ncbi:MAG TPA: hypoxanthine phosphoribosyltransferase [Elusimicrobiota bacterium]|jgi:hypoxanthine phosphoribosyltransferase|nr:hypoxanthine phosphoribosyltransferase [Elusimicrobiota bacterium]
MPTESNPIPAGVERILLDEGSLRARVAELGGQISRDYAGKKPVLIGILKGSVVFLADLMRSLRLDCSVDFMSVSSYEAADSTGVVRVNLDLKASAAGKDLVVVEDIVDTGLTLHYLLDNLRTRGPRSLEVCALLDKPECRRIPVKAKYVGFAIPNDFVVGYGLDFDERYRNLPYVAVLKKDAINHGK